MQARPLALLALCIALPAGLWAQAQGSIQGVVTDNTGAVIPGASVTIINNDTGVERTTQSNQVGFYQVPALNPGPYTATATSDGFAPAEAAGLQVQVAQILRVDFTMNLGQVTEVIEVSAAAQLVQSEKTEVGQVIDSKRILEMPLNGRNYLELAKFATGVLPSRELGKGTRQDGERGGEGGILAMGMHAAQTNVLLDGADNSSRNSGGALGFQAQSTKPSIDAVQEFKVVTNNISAEFGYRMGAKVIVSTKSGTNQIHGSAYEFLRNDKLDGTNFFANRSGSEKPTLRRNQLGATIGGPIVKNKMFYFVSWQSTYERLGQSFISSVPTAAVKSGDFSGEPNPNRLIYDPLTLGDDGVRTQFPNLIVPATRFDPVSTAVLDIVPDPNQAGTRNNYFFSPSDSINSHQYDFKWDYNVTEDHRTFIRYSIRDEDVINSCPLPLPACGGTGQTIDLPGDNVAASFQSTFGTSMFNELRFGFTHFPTRFDIPFTENLQSQFGIKGAPGDTLDDGLDHGYALFNASGFRNIGPRGFWPNVNKLDNLQIADSFSIIRGRHTIKFGGEYRRTDVPRYPSRHRRGQFQFSGQYTAEIPGSNASRGNTGSSMADMLLGWANNEVWGFPNGEEVLVPYQGFFVQDDWKVTNRLTLNLGLRYERYIPPRYPDVSNQTVSRFLTGINGRPFGDGEGLPVNAPGSWGEAEYLPFFVQPLDSRDSGAKTDNNNFAPRVGLAYRATQKTVLRMGAGIMYGEADSVQAEHARFSTGAPLANEFNAQQPFATTELFVENGFAPVTPEGFPRAGLSASTFADGAIPQYYSAQWFFDLQQQLPFETLLTIGYIGTSGSQYPGAINVNRPVTLGDGSINVNQRRVRPFFNNVNQRGTLFLNQNYNALQVKAEKRLTQGFTFLSSFTWSHNIDYGSENLTQGTTAQQRYTYNQSIERSNANLDRRLAYVLSTVYELPFGKGKSYLNGNGIGRWILGDWQIGGILSLLAGTPDSHSFNRNTTGVGGANRGDILRDPNLPSSERSIDRWFDTGFVTAGQPFQLDNAGRNLIVGPPTRNFDFSLSRRFFLPMEGHFLQFRFESFNFTNTPTFGRPNTSVGSANAGIITTAGEPRRIQFGLKYVF